MKKIAFTLVFSTLMLQAFCQDEGFRFGFDFSPAFTWLANNADNNAVEGDGSNFAFKMGAVGEYYFRENYALKSGIYMTFNQGGNLKFNSLDANGNAVFSDSQPDVIVQNGQSVNFNHQYIEIPFALKMRTNEVGYFRYYAEIPVITLGAQLSARGSVDGSDDYKVNKDTWPIGIAWGLGGGAEYSVTENTSIVAGVFFQSGILGTYNPNVGISDIDDSKTIINGVTIRIGVLF